MIFLFARNFFNMWLLLLLRIRVPCKKREFYRQFIFCETSIEGPRRPYPTRHETCFVVIVVQLLSRIRLFATPWTAARQAPLSFTVSWSLLKLMSIESVMPSSVTLFSSCPRSFPASGSFPMSGLFTSGGQSTGASVSASVLPVNIPG